MPFSDFTLPELKRDFGLTFQEQTDLFHSIPEVAASEHLQTTLLEHTPLALAIHTEKARSELILTPILVEIRRVLERRISLFSGVEFNVAPEKGLDGVCDFILSGSEEQLVLTIPVVVLVEAKNDNIKAGLAQCIAEMVAAQIYNQREDNGIRTVYGVVSTGSIWKFLKLENNIVFVDVPEYYLERIGKILGIFVYLMQEALHSGRHAG
jgi:hypothetical protein